jgi:hemerythrin-like domain-containing protein
MHPHLQELHQDHLNFARILALLEKQLGMLRLGQNADLHVLIEIVDYMQSYPDLLHHPREDVIFSTCLERSPQDNEMLKKLMAEHQSLVQQTRALRELLDQWELGSPLPRETIAASIEEYLRVQWEHLNLEESTIYQMLSAQLTDEDWLRIGAALPSGSDPLFGEMIQQRYEHIFEQLFEYA